MQKTGNGIGGRMTQIWNGFCLEQGLRELCSNLVQSLTCWGWDTLVSHKNNEKVKRMLKKAERMRKGEVWAPLQAEKPGWTSQAEVTRVQAPRLVSIHLASPHRYLYLRLYFFLYLYLEVLYLLTHSLPTSVGTNTIQVERVVTRGNRKGILGIRALVFTIDIFTVMFFVCIL